MQRLAHLTDHIGHRLSGSKNLERAIEWAVTEMKRDGLDNVRAEKVMVPHWVRGEESLEMLTPLPRKLTMLGLGNSVGTPAEGISAEAVVVRNFAELDRLGEQVRGKIVVYNVPFTTYGATVIYRLQGASRAARYGAVGGARAFDHAGESANAAHRSDALRSEPTEDSSRSHHDRSSRAFAAHERSRRSSDVTAQDGSEVSA